MNHFTKQLIDGLELDERIAVSRRVDIMMAELKYMSEFKKEVVQQARRKGWSQKKLEVVFILNSFYQRIVRPLLASAEPPKVFGKNIPIRYGKKILFDEDRNKANLKMAITFMKLCRKSGVSLNLLESLKTNDVIWNINKVTDQFDEE